MGAEGAKKRTIIFTYGTLKRGFSNHVLLQDMIATGDASFSAFTKPPIVSPSFVGPTGYHSSSISLAPGECVWGELYAVSASGLIRMDELEGIIRGHYERLPIKVQAQAQPDEDSVTMAAEAYYAHRNYAAAMWKRNGEIGFSIYSEKEAKGYVKRKDRPQHLTFLEQIGIFISSSDEQENLCYCNKHLSTTAAPLPIDVVNH